MKKAIKRLRKKIVRFFFGGNDLYCHKPTDESRLIDEYLLFLGENRQFADEFEKDINSVVVAKSMTVEELVSAQKLLESVSSELKVLYAEQEALFYRLSSRQKFSNYDAFHFGLSVNAKLAVNIRMALREKESELKKKLRERKIG